MHDKKPVKLEKDLMRTCEFWLVHRGYRRMTASEAIEAAQPGAVTLGWIAHLNRPIGNPLFPDHWLANAEMTRILPIEYKVQEAYQEGQREMITSGRWKIAWTFDGFRELVEAWECNRTAQPGMEI